MILITGATGLIGAHLMLELLLANKKIRALKRPHSSLEEVQSLFEKKKQLVLWNQIEWVDGDITDITTLNPIFKDIKEVYHVAGLVSFDDRKSKELYEINVKGTANMVNFSINSDVERFLYVSSIAVMDSVNNELITEESEFLNKKPHSKYACSKYEGEMEVWRGSQEGLNVVIVNPGVVLGSGFWNQSSGEIFKKSLQGYYTSGGSAFVSVEDVAKCSVQLMDKECFNERFIIISENISYKKLVKTICTAKKRNVQSISNTMLKGIRIISWWAALIGLKDFLSQPTYESLLSTTSYDNSKIKKLLNYHFKTIDQTLSSILEKYPVGLHKN